MQTGTTTGGLFERLRTGDTQAKAEFFVHIAGRLHSLATRELNQFKRDRILTTSDDLCQEATIALLAAVEKAETKSLATFVAICARTMQQTLIEIHRKARGRDGTRLRLPGIVGRTDVPVANVPERRYGPSDIAELNELRDGVSKVREELRKELRDVLDCTYWLGLTLEDTATALGVSTKTVRRRLRAIASQYAGSPAASRLK